MRSRHVVKAVWDSDLEALLKSTGLLESLLEGELSCDICGRIVDLDNLGALFPYANDVKVSCDRTQCVRGASTKGVALSSG